MLNMSELDIITQALFNQGDTYGKGSATRMAFHGLAKEIKRLKRVQEDEETRERLRRFKENVKERKVRGEPNDDIPF